MNFSAELLFALALSKKSASLNLLRDTLRKNLMKQSVDLSEIIKL